MRFILSASFLCWFLTISVGQQTINGSITHAGLEREYILYVPDSYTPGTAAPLVLNFHGYTSNNLEQFLYSDFRPIADTAGFLVVHPMGTVDLLGNPHWNVGWGSSTVDDVGFTSALIDSLSATYTINQDRIYSTGMSNGGFFSYKLACDLSHRIAAIASVTGTMNIGQTATCSPSHPMPVMEIHGTADETVAYEGNFFFEPIPNVVAWWTAFDGCDLTPNTSVIDDSNTDDGCTAEHYVFVNGQNGSSVEHYKIIGGQHTWPGSAFGGFGTNQDINASKEIWRFFSKYDIHGLRNPTSIAKNENLKSLSVYPNPVAQTLFVEWPEAEDSDFSIHSGTGQQMLSGKLVTGQNRIDLSHVASGMYIMTAGNQVRYQSLIVVLASN